MNLKNTKLTTYGNNGKDSTLKGALASIALLIAIMKCAGLDDLIDFSEVEIEDLPTEYNTVVDSPYGVCNIKTIADKVIRIKCKGIIVIVNFELKSCYDPEVLLQVRDQEASIMNYWCKKLKVSFKLKKDGTPEEVIRILDPDTDKLPIIVNIVVYTGKNNWYRRDRLNYLNWFPDFKGEPTFMCPKLTFLDMPRLSEEQMKRGGYPQGVLWDP